MHTHMHTHNIYHTCTHTHTHTHTLYEQVTFCRLTIGNLEAEVERRVAELAALKNKVSDLTGAMSELRKELEVKGQEILSVRREANTQVQLSG